MLSSFPGIFDISRGVSATSRHEARFTKDLMPDLWAAELDLHRWEPASSFLGSTNTPEKLEVRMPVLIILL